MWKIYMSPLLFSFWFVSYVEILWICICIYIYNIIHRYICIYIYSSEELWTSYPWLLWSASRRRSSASLWRRRDLHLCVLVCHWSVGKAEEPRGLLEDQWLHWMTVNMLLPVDPDWSHFSDDSKNAFGVVNSDLYPNAHGKLQNNSFSLDFPDFPGNLLVSQWWQPQLSQCNTLW